MHQTVVPIFCRGFRQFFWQSVYHTLGYLAGLEADTNYVASLWLSLLGNVAVTEIILHRKPIAAFLFQTKRQTQTEP